MNFILMPCLEHMALVKIAVTLWNQEQRLIIQVKLPSYTSGIARNGEWQAIEDKVIKNVLQLSQPNVIKEKILCIIKPIGLEILNWLIEANRLLIDNTQYLDELYWTAAGTIDRRKTVEMYIKNMKLDSVKHLYIFACNYCMVDEIPKLWSSCSKSFREICYDETAVALNQMDIVHYWNSVMLGKVSDWNDIMWDNSYSAYQNAFLISSIRGNKDASKYFLRKLNSRERTKCFVKLTAYLKNGWFYYSTDIMCFLLPLFNKQQETKIFKTNKVTVLYGLLKWPLQTLFMEMANRMWDILSVGDFQLVVNYIIEILIAGYKDYNYKKLIGEFWQQMPKTLKRRVVKTIKPEILSKFLKIKDLENFFSILKEATAEECLRIFSHRPSDWDAFTDPNDEFYSLPFMTQVYVSYSTENNDKFVKEIKERIFLTRTEEEIEKEKDIWNELFRGLHDHIPRNRKRTTEEKERGPIKCMRLQIAELEDA